MVKEKNKEENESGCKGDQEIGWGHWGKWNGQKRTARENFCICAMEEEQFVGGKVGKRRKVC